MQWTTRFQTLVGLGLLLCCLPQAWAGCEFFPNEIEMDRETDVIDVYCMNDDLHRMEVGESFITANCRECVCRQHALVCCRYYGGGCSPRPVYRYPA